MGLLRSRSPQALAGPMTAPDFDGSAISSPNETERRAGTIRGEPNMDDPVMDENERHQILTLLQQGRAAVPAAVAGVGNELASRIPAPGRWSILGCVEHIAFSEDYLFAQMGKAVVSSTPHCARFKD